MWKWRRSTRVNWTLAMARRDGAGIGRLDGVAKERARQGACDGEFCTRAAALEDNGSACARGVCKGASGTGARLCESGDPGESRNKSESETACGRSGQIF